MNSETTRVARIPAQGAYGCQVHRRRRALLLAATGYVGACYLAVCCVAVCCLGPTPAAAVEARSLASAAASMTSSEIHRHVEALAADALEGRDAGSRGGYAAGGYLIEQLRKHRLAGGGEAGAYHQPLPTGGRNILALVPGSDPKLRDEIIVVGAHYDHVGYGTPSNSNGQVGLIHNGADDNASGTAGLLEIAEAFTRLAAPPRRSVLLAWWDGEEDGLLGSKHWISHPTLPRARIKMALNMDMIGRLRNDRVEVTGARSATGLRHAVSRLNVDQPLLLDYQWECKDNSDHWPFLAEGIPTLMFHTGLHDDYHKPSDDVERLNSDGARRVARLMFLLAAERADAPSLPPFRDRCRQEATEDDRRRFERPLPAPAARLGLRWSERDRREGLLVAAVDDDSAAREAGIRPGDRLIAFEGCSLAEEHWKNDEEFIGHIWAARSPVEFTLMRPGESEPRTASVRLRGGAVRLGFSWRADQCEPRSMMIVQLYRGSPAALAGARVGDRIESIDGQDFDGAAEFERLVTSRSLPFEMRVDRAGRLLTLVAPALRLPQAPPRAPEP